MNLYASGTLGAERGQESVSLPSRVGRIHMFYLCLCIHVQIFAMRSNCVKEIKRNDDTCLEHLSVTVWFKFLILII